MICSKCKIEKSPEEFTRNRTRKSGYGSECKQCARERAREKYSNNPEKYQEKNQEWITRNKEKQLEMQKRWRDENKEYRKLYDIEYRKNNEDIHEKARKRLKIWVENNPERHRLNKMKSSQKRRAIKRSCESDLTAQQINNLIKNSENICFWCDTYTEKIHLDHIIPLSKNGEDKIMNLVVSCPTCNMRKGDKMPEDWLDILELERSL